jgi:hypothetical protein
LAALLGREVDMQDLAFHPLGKSWPAPSVPSISAFSRPNPKPARHFPGSLEDLSPVAGNTSAPRGIRTVENRHATGRERRVAAGGNNFTREITRGIGAYLLAVGGILECIWQAKAKA